MEIYQRRQNHGGLGDEIIAQVRETADGTTHASLTRTDESAGRATIERSSPMVKELET